jgi:hypothetical protein
MYRKVVFAVTFLMVLLIGKLICCLLSFRLFYNHKQFCSRFVASVEYVPGLKQLLNDVF